MPLYILVDLTFKENLNMLQRLFTICSSVTFNYKKKTKKTNKHLTIYVKYTFSTQPKKCINLYTV